jgi:hypothetical protein
VAEWKALSFLDGNFGTFPVQIFFNLKQLFFFQSHPMAMHILLFTEMFKNLKTWRYSNPGSSILEADAMTTMPRRPRSYF